MTNKKLRQRTVIFEVFHNIKGVCGAMLSERTPCMRKVGCLNRGSDRPKSLKHLNSWSEWQGSLKIT